MSNLVYSCTPTRTPFELPVNTYSRIEEAGRTGLKELRRYEIDFHARGNRGAMYWSITIFLGHTILTWEKIQYARYWCHKNMPSWGVSKAEGCPKAPDPRLARRHRISKGLPSPADRGQRPKWEQSISLANTCTCSLQLYYLSPTPIVKGRDIHVKVVTAYFVVTRY